MMHPHTELRDAGREMGLGVFATRRIPRGTIVWCRDALDHCLPLERVREMPLAYRKLLDRYGFLDEHGDRILCWDFGRFVNHSCDPNVLPTPWRAEIAVRTIHAGEQITNDYATLNLERAFRCGCRAAGCRGVIRPNDFESLVATWDERLGSALPALVQVEQPLMRWIAPNVGRTIRRASRMPELVPSVASIRLEAARADPLAFAAVPRRRARRRGAEWGRAIGTGATDHPPAEEPSRDVAQRDRVDMETHREHLTRSPRDPSERIGRFGSRTAPGRTYRPGARRRPAQQWRTEP